MPWTIYLIAYMFGQFLAAWLGRRMESRRVLLYGMSIAAACNVFLGFLVDSHRASVFLWLCITMGIHGLAQATGWSHNVALFANWTRRSERGTLFASASLAFHAITLATDDATTNAEWISGSCKDVDSPRCCPKTATGATIHSTVWCTTTNAIPNRNGRQS